MIICELSHTLKCLEYWKHMKIGCISLETSPFIIPFKLWKYYPAILYNKKYSKHGGKHFVC